MKRKFDQITATSRNEFDAIGVDEHLSLFDKSMKKERTSSTLINKLEVALEINVGVFQVQIIFNNFIERVIIIYLF